jgi:hypothetical protein
MRIKDEVMKEEVKSLLRFISPSMNELIHFTTVAQTIYCTMYIYDDFSKEKVVELLSKLEKARRHLSMAIDSLREIVRKWDRIASLLPSPREPLPEEGVNN